MALGASQVRRRHKAFTVEMTGALILSLIIFVYGFWPQKSFLYKDQGCNLAIAETE